VTYVSEDVVSNYNDALDAAANRKRLVSYLQAWQEFAPDARAIVKAMTERDFDEWRAGLTKERSGEFAGEEWARRFGVVLMPERMVRTTVIAQRFAVPWGLAWLRLKEEGVLDGLAADRDGGTA